MKTLPSLTIEFYRHASAWVLSVMFLGALVLRLRQPVWTWSDLTVVAIMTAYWPVHEWLLHVFTLHARPRKIGPFTLDLPVAKAHRAHHEDPWNLDKVFIPLSTYFLLPIIWAGFIFSPLSLPVALSGLTWYFFLSVQYEWLHFLTHTRYVPKGAIYRRLWLNHRLHHCKNENYWYGVTMLSGDKLFGTAPDAQATPLSPTCRSILGAAPDQQMGPTA